MLTFSAIETGAIPLGQISQCFADLYGHIRFGISALRYAVADGVPELAVGVRGVKVCLMHLPSTSNRQRYDNSTGVMVDGQ